MCPGPEQRAVRGVSTILRSCWARFTAASLPPALGHIAVPRHPSEQTAAIDIDGEPAQGVRGLRAEEHRDPSMVLGGEPSPLGDQGDPLPSRLFVGVPLVHGGVIVVPGQIAFTLMPCGATSDARCRVKPRSPAFEAV